MYLRVTEVVPDLLNTFWPMDALRLLLVLPLVPALLSVRAILFVPGLLFDWRVSAVPGTVAHGHL